MVLLFLQYKTQEKLHESAFDLSLKLLFSHVMNLPQNQICLNKGKVIETDINYET